MRNKIITGSVLLLIGFLCALQWQAVTNRDTIQQVRTEALREIASISQETTGRFKDIEFALAKQNEETTNHFAALESEFGLRLDRLSVFPQRLAGPPVVVEQSHPGFKQLGARYASIGSGDLKHLTVYSNAAFAVFEHTAAVLPLDGTVFVPQTP